MPTHKKYWKKCSGTIRKCSQLLSIEQSLEEAKQLGEIGYILTMQEKFEEAMITTKKPSPYTENSKTGSGKRWIKEILGTCFIAFESLMKRKCITRQPLGFTEKPTTDLAEPNSYGTAWRFWKLKFCDNTWKLKEIVTLHQHRIFRSIYYV